MKKIAIAFAGMTAAIALSACGPDNVQACKDYVAAVNAEYEACEIESNIDEGSTCPDSLNEGGADCTEYYGCLADGYTCNDGTMDIDTGDCTGCV